MKTRNDLLTLLDQKEIHRFVAIRTERRLCSRCGRVSWDPAVCRTCRQELDRERLRSITQK